MLPGHSCAVGQLQGEAGWCGWAALLGCDRKGPHCPGGSFVKLLPGFVLDCLQDVPGHLLEGGSA